MRVFMFSFSTLNCVLITYTRLIIKRSEGCHAARESLALYPECGMVVKQWIGTSALITSKGQVCMRG